MHLSWIIPAYNEEKRIEKTIREVEAYLRTKNFSYEILVVDNRSRDQTAAIVSRLTDEIPPLRLVRATEPGKGAAVKRGMAEAAGEIRIFADADNSTGPAYFDAMEPFFQKGYGVVISSRDPKDAAGAGRDVNEPWYREFMGNLGNVMIQLFGVWGIWDTQNGFKAFSQEAAETIFPRLTVAGWAFDIEVLVLAKRYGLPVAVIPVKWRYAEDSKVTLAAYIQVLRDVLKIRANLMTGRYGGK